MDTELDNFLALLEKSVFFPLKTTKHLEKFQKIGIGHAKLKISGTLLKIMAILRKKAAAPFKCQLQDAKHLPQHTKGLPGGSPTPICEATLVSRIITTF